MEDIPANFLGGTTEKYYDEMTYCDEIHQEIDEMSNTDWFLASDNVKHVATRCYNIFRNRGGAQCDMDNFVERVHTLMRVWAKKECIDEFESLFNDFLMIKRMFNKKFMDAHLDLFQPIGKPGFNKIPDHNPHRAHSRILKHDLSVNGESTSSDNTEYDPRDYHEKDHVDLLASDYQSLDVWKEQSTFATPRNYRFGNKLPDFYTHAMRSRNKYVDRDEPDGLTHDDPDRASLTMFAKKTGHIERMLEYDKKHRKNPVQYTNPPPPRRYYYKY